MYSSSISILAVGLASIASVILGFIWFSPSGFGKQWMKANKFTEQDRTSVTKGDLALMYGVTFINAILTSIVMALLLQNLFVPILSEAIVVALLVGIGFMVTSSISMFLFSNKNHRSYTALGINLGYYLVSFVLQAFIIFIFS